MCGIPSFVPPAGRCQKASKHVCRTWGWKIKREVLLLLCSLITSLCYQPSCEKFTSPPSLCSTGLRPRGMTLLNKPQLGVFLQQNTACAQLVAAPWMESSWRQLLLAGEPTMGTIPAPNPQLCLHLRAGDNRGTKENFITSLGRVWCVLWNRGQAKATVDAKVG